MVVRRVCVLSGVIMQQQLLHNNKETDFITAAVAEKGINICVKRIFYGCGIQKYYGRIIVPAG